MTRTTTLTHEQVRIRMAGRQRKRMERKEAEERRERILEPIKVGVQVLGIAILAYAYFFFGCLWASM